MVDESITVSDCNSLDGWSYSGNAANMQLNTSGLNGNSVYVYTGYGALRKLTYTDTSGLDLSKYHQFEFDFQCFKNNDASFKMWDAIQSSYENYIGVEIGDGSQTERFTLSDMTITESGNNWYHASVEVPSDSKVNLTNFKTFCFYTLPTTPLDTTLPDAIFKIDNVIAVLSEGQPSEVSQEGVWQIPGSMQKNNTTGTFSFVLNQFSLDLSAYQKNELYLTMRIYIENTDGSDNILEFTNEGQIELTSSGNCDKQEANWSVPKLGLKSGWNNLKLLISNAANDNGLNLANINYFRFYSRAAGDDTFNVRIEDIAITNLKEEHIVSSYFSNGMMFQQNKPMNVFGNVETAGQNIKAELSDGTNVLETVNTVSQSDGSFSLAFAARAGGYTPYTIKIYVEDKLTETIENILIGELWLAAGQSNMEYFVLQTIKDYDYSLIPLNEKVRFFDIPLVPGGVTAILPSSPVREIEGAKWADGSNAVDVKYISAIAYYMSLELQQQLNVPVGFLNTAKGASVIESWMPREVIENTPQVKSVLQSRGIYKTAEQLDQTTSNWTYLTTLFNAKIAPLAGVEISGVLWYQGESNVKYADEDGYNTFYEYALDGLIDSYSKLFGFENGNMPFVCAHLAPYNNASIRANDYTTVLATFAEMLNRVAEKSSSKLIQIPIYDLSLQYKDPPINNPDPIHPNSKKDVADRFAAAVLAGVYGVGNADGFTAPSVASVQMNGNKAVLTFKNVGDTLKINDSSDTLHGFAVADASRVFVKANAKITSPNTVEVWSDAVAAPVAVIYAWSSFNMVANLANSLGIPAVPYRSDKVASIYDLSTDWGYCDSATTWEALTSLDAGFKPTFSTSANAVVTADAESRYEGIAAAKLSYEISGTDTAVLAPVLNYGGMIKQYQHYTGISLYAKNPDVRAKKLSVRLVAGGETFYATAVTGSSLSTAYEINAGDYQQYTFNFKRLVNAEGKVLPDSTTILKTLADLQICVEDNQNGIVLFDAMTLRADTLPTPGSETDVYAEAIEDTTPGSLDKNGNMWFNDAENKNGWSSSGSTVQNDTALFTQGKASVGTTAPKGVLKQLVYSPGTSLDVSSYDYLEFDLYTSNMEWFNTSESIMFELTSSGSSDNESNRYMKGYLRDNVPELYSAGVAGSTQPGWYHVKLKLAAPQTTARGGLNAQKLNYFRFFAIGAPQTTSDFDVRLDNMKFTREGTNGEGNNGGNVISPDLSYGKKIDDNSVWMTNAETDSCWKASGTTVSMDFAQKTEGNSSISAVAKGGVLKQISFEPKAALDISDYQYLEFDVFFSHLSWFKACEGTMFELTSAGVCDKESNRYTKSSMLEASPSFADDVESGKGGNKWYHFKLNLDRPHASVKGGLDKTGFDYFRFYSVQVKEGTPDYTVKFDNMKFTKGEKQPDVIRTKDYLIINNADSAAGWSASGQEVMPDKNNKTEGDASITVTAKNGILKELVYRPAKPIDISDYHYLQFDLFLSDITFLNTTTGWMVELTSSGTCDVESNRYMKSTILTACPELAADFNAGDVGNKWYHFCFNLDKPQNQARGGLNNKAMNYFRIYFIGAEPGSPDCVINLDNLQVTTAGVQSATATGGQTISIGGSVVPGKNVGNKLNGGLRAEALSAFPKGLVRAVIATGIALGVTVIAAGVLGFLLFKKKKE